jgi:hypothetical protein
VFLQCDAEEKTPLWTQLTLTGRDAYSAYRKGQVKYLAEKNKAEGQVRYRCKNQSPLHGFSELCSDSCLMRFPLPCLFYRGSRLGRHGGGACAISDWSGAYSRFEPGRSLFGELGCAKSGLNRSLLTLRRKEQGSVVPGTLILTGSPDSADSMIPSITAKRSDPSIGRAGASTIPFAISARSSER